MINVINTVKNFILSIPYLGVVNLVIVSLLYIWLLIVIFNKNFLNYNFFKASDYKKILIFSIALAFSIRIALTNSFDDSALKLMFTPRYLLIALFDASLIFLGLRIVLKLPKFSTPLIFISWFVFGVYLFFILGKSKHLGYLVVARDFSIAKNISIITPGFYLLKLIEEKIVQVIIGFFLPFITGAILLITIKKAVFYRPRKWVKQEILGLSLYIALIFLFCNHIAYQYYNQYVNKGSITPSDAVSLMGLYEAQSSIYSPSYSKKPKNYKQKIDNAVKDIKTNYNDIKPIVTKAPNTIIYFANESFFRADRLFKEARKPDIVKKLYSAYDGLLKTGGIGGVVSVAPIFGAGTNDSEFFVESGLTSHTITKFFKQNIPSIISYYKSLGYKTIYAHIVVDDFFNYKETTTKLGFDEIYLGSYFNEVWGNDEKLYAKMQDRILEAEKNNEKIMIFFVDIGRHAPFEKSKELNKKWFGTEEVQESEIASYFEKSEKSNELATKFIDFLNKMPNEVALTIFGDHQPLLDRLKLLGDKRMYTDFYIWSNKRSLKGYYDVASNKNFSSAKLHSLTAYLFGLPLRDIDRYYLSTDKDLLVDPYNILFCYDILTGKQYAKELFELPASAFSH